MKAVALKRIVVCTYIFNWMLNCTTKDKCDSLSTVDRWSHVIGLVQTDYLQQNGVMKSKHGEDARDLVSSEQRIANFLVDARTVSVSGSALAAVVVVAALAGAGVCSLLQRRR